MANEALQSLGITPEMFLAAAEAAGRYDPDVRGVTSWAESVAEDVLYAALTRRQGGGASREGVDLKPEGI